VHNFEGPPSIKEYPYDFSDIVKASSEKEQGERL
jgi:hypothetical protein